MIETAKKEKSLTCTGRPATSAYARAWGTVVSPTVRPASRSICSHLRLYLGSQERIGTQAFKVLEEQQPLTTDIRSSSGWSIVYRWDIREENLEISGGKVKMTANKWWRRWSNSQTFTSCKYRSMIIAKKSYLQKNDWASSTVITQHSFLAPDFPRIWFCMCPHRPSSSSRANVKDNLSM